jgi:hypothetical protein
MSASPLGWDFEQRRLGGAVIHGRDDMEWNELVVAGHKYLREVASKGTVVNYTQFNGTLEDRTGLQGFDFESDLGRDQLSHLLGAIAARDREDNPDFMITSLVGRKGDYEPGKGFYDLAQSWNYKFDVTTKDGRFNFWQEQLKLTREALEKAPRVRY